MPCRSIMFFDERRIVACDGKCTKAWGVSQRPKVEFDPKEPDDVAWLADDELGESPAHPGTWEGGHGKDPLSLNKWCVRECERSRMFAPDEEIKLPDFTVRLYNQPWKHTA